MLLLERYVVAKAKGGRPRKQDGDSGTSQIRVFDDIAEMLSDLSLVLPQTIAQVVDPFLRPEISELHARYKSQIDGIKAAQQNVESLIEEARKKAEEELHPTPSPPRKPKKV